MEAFRKLKALTKDSKHLSDYKDVKVKSFGDMASNKTHIEFFCEVHMRDRLKNYCHQDTLVDVIMSRIELKFSNVSEKYAGECKSCPSKGIFRIDRND